MGLTVSFLGPLLSASSLRVTCCRSSTVGVGEYRLVLKTGLRPSKVAQWGKVPVTKTYDLSCILRIHVAEEENQYHKFVL